MTDVILSAGTWKNNSELLLDCVRLGYLHPDWSIRDTTWGRGRFWKHFCPAGLVGSDIDPEKSPIGHGVDARSLGEPDDHWDAVVIDPPYGMRGTTTGRSLTEMDADFGLETYMPPPERMKLIRDMMTEGCRVLKPNGTLLLKCQDQTVSGKKVWQSIAFANHGYTLGLRLVDQMHLKSYRSQPEGRRQVHSHSNFSTMQVYKKEALSGQYKDLHGFCSDPSPEG